MREVVLEGQEVVIDVRELVLAGLGLLHAGATGIGPSTVLLSTLTSMTQKGWVAAGWLTVVSPSLSVSSLTGRHAGNPWARAACLHGFTM